ncbi:MAG: hypothetical protein ACLPX9_13915 [Rhodomicrobium sp.]
MQIIETSSLGVRSAFFRLEGGPGEPSFGLFPMLHVGEQAFYDDVTWRLGKCDIILYEGVKFTSWSSSLLASCYESLAKSPRLGLVTQKVMKLDHLADRLVHADVSGNEFASQWSKLDRGVRAAVAVTAPIARLYFQHFATRQSIAAYLGLNLLKSREEILQGSDFEAMDEVVLSWRDRHLIKVLEEHRQKHRGSPASIAVVFGAAHMRAVVRYLTSIHDPRYRVAASEWMTVFRL